MELEGEPSLPALDSTRVLFEWYTRHLCNAKLRDPRGLRVCFGENEFIHLIKLTHKFGKEPRNKKLAISQIRRDRFPLRHGDTANYDRERVQNLGYAGVLVQEPDFIVKNWQARGKAYPGEVYVRDFGSSGKRKYLTLVCAIAGAKRVPVTMFAKQSITHMDAMPRLWP